MKSLQKQKPNFISYNLPIIKLAIVIYCNLMCCLAMLWFWFSGVKHKRVGPSLPLQPPPRHTLHPYLPFFSDSYLLKLGSHVVLPVQETATTAISYKTRELFVTFFYIDSLTLFFKFLLLFKMAALNIN